MIGIVLLFAASVSVGFLLGYFLFTWLAISISGLLFASVTAWLLQAQGYGLVGGIGAIVACLTVNQFLFLVGCFLRMSHETTDDELSSKCGDDEPRSCRNDSIDCDEG